LSLTRTEYGILELLASQVGRVVFRETLLEVVWEDREPGSNKLDVAVRSLRRKLEAAGSPDLIQTMYGMGYSISDDKGAL
jgi:DNA-binding response OmpR family regulator